MAQDRVATLNRHDVSHETDFPRVGAVARMTLSRRGLAKAGLRCPLSPARVTAGFLLPVTFPDNATYCSHKKKMSIVDLKDFVATISA